MGETPRLRHEDGPGCWKIRGGILRFEKRPLVMGVLNVTPDSFYDGGRHAAAHDAVRHGIDLARHGADILDIGGMSTRPGSLPVSLEEELHRVIPVIESLGSTLSIPISIDTYRSDVARAALEAGARIINDVSAFRFDRGMAGLAASSGAGVVLMHMRGDPLTMQSDTQYEDLMGEIRSDLAGRIASAQEAGVESDQIVIDPGIGFGKNDEQNVEILKHLDDLRSLGRPLLVGPSRKSFIGRFLGRDPQERLAGTLACVAMLFLRAVEVVRVHDVRETRDFLKMLGHLAPS